MLDEKTKIKQHQQQFDEYQNEKNTCPPFTMNTYAEWKEKK